MPAAANAAGRGGSRPARYREAWLSQRLVQGGETPRKVRPVAPDRLLVLGNELARVLRRLDAGGRNPDVRRLATQQPGEPIYPSGRLWLEHLGRIGASVGEESMP